MLPFPLQTVLLVLAGFGLFRLWRAATPEERWLRWVVAGGFLIRALAGQALFWISWARLAFARGWQMGHGFWWFAPDAKAYFEESAFAALGGPAGILQANPKQPSVVFAQTLATALWLFGEAPAVGLLLNLACYLGSIALILRWSADRPAARFATAFAIVAITFSPAFMLWSLQPLKETFFAFLFVAFVFGCAVWQRTWLERGHGRGQIVIGILLCVLLYALTGIRWYFGLLVLAAATLFFILSAFRATGRRTLAFIASVLLVVALSRVFLLSAGPIVPPAIAAMLTPRTAFAGMANLGGRVLPILDRTREGFDGSGGNTRIQIGERLDARQPAKTAEATTSSPLQVAEAVPQKLPAEAPPAAPRPASPSATPRVAAVAAAIPAAAKPPAEAAPASQPAPATFNPEHESAIRGLIESQSAAWNRADVDGYLSPYVNSPELSIATGNTAIHGRDQAERQYREQFTAPDALGSLQFENVQIAGEGDHASATGSWTISRGGESSSTPFTMHLERLGDEWKIVKLESRAAGTQHAAIPEQPVRTTESNAPTARVNTETKTSPLPKTTHHPVKAVPSSNVAAAPSAAASKPEIAKPSEQTAAAPASATAAGSPPAPVAAPAVAAPTTVAAPAEPVRSLQEEEGPMDRPQAATARLLSGIAAIALPRSIGEALGFFHVGGGRGMLWFTDLDTLVFDLILLCALAVFLRFPASWRNPLVWFVLCLTILVTVPLAYAVTNFGTLFRLREMIYIGLALVPLAATTAWRVDAREAQPDQDGGVPEGVVPAGSLEG